MPTLIHTWRCDKCFRSYPSFARAAECEETCAETRQWSAPPNPDAKTHYRGRHDA